MVTRYQNRLKWLFTLLILVGVSWTIFNYNENEPPIIQYMPLLAMFALVLIIGLASYISLPIRRLAKMAGKSEWAKILKYSERINLSRYRGDEKAGIQIYIMIALFAENRISEAKNIYSELNDYDPELAAISNVIDSWGTKFQLLRITDALPCSLDPLAAGTPRAPSSLNMARALR